MMTHFWTSSRGKQVTITIAVAVIGLVVFLFWQYIRYVTRTAESRLLEAQQSFRHGQFHQAETAARLVLERDPGNCRAVHVAARAAFAAKRPADALEYLKRVLGQSESSCVACLKSGAEMALESGYLGTCELFLKRIIQVDPDDINAANQLAYLLGVEGRAFESIRPIFAAVKAGQFTPHHLIMLAAGEPVVNDQALVEKCLAALPSDPLPLLGQAREKLGNQDFSAAAELLKRILAVHPDSQEAQARWGHYLLEHADETQFLEWHTQQPEHPWHPEIWIVRGLWARMHQENRVAIRCFGEALSRDPNHRLACYQLGQLLKDAGSVKLSNDCFARASRLEQLAYLVDRIYENPQAVHLLAEAAVLTESLGRYWEAWGWANGSVLTNPSDAKSSSIKHRIQPRLTANLPQTHPESQLAGRLNLPLEPLPDWRRVSPGKGHKDISRQEVVGNGVHFVEISQDSGLQFLYDNGHEPGSQTSRMLESMGGGVAVTDFDLDGWPDLYFTQAGPWQISAPQKRPPDQFFRNQFGSRLVDITSASHLGDCEFSQGCSVGDIDADGFPDVYVANIGSNVLYLNQGDGTFENVTPRAGFEGTKWTTSCAIVDLNGDCLPEIYDVNYLNFQDAPRTLCVRGEEARTCGPGSFTAEPDQLFLNLGDGGFREITRSSGIDVPNGKGLGIVVADFAGTGQLCLFVANDSVPNFFFVPVPSSERDVLTFSNQALLSGLALNQDGLSAAWMGVAAGDVNRDGLVDLFCTTYADQAKSLFLQDKLGMVFTDSIIQSGLKSPTWKALGFGTQFLDADLDGWLDIVTTNGHVFDLSHKNQAYQMAPQFFRNRGKAQFQEVPPEEIGPFFSGKYLGRGLAKLDWNRDGREDFVVSHMLARAALVENRTVASGHFLSLHLIGTHCNREAIGSRVTLRVGNQSWTHQLTAGDGYQAANQRALHFGVGNSVVIDKLTIEWLHGNPTSFTNVKTNSHWIAIEGRDQLLEFRPSI